MLSQSGGKKPHECVTQDTFKGNQQTDHKRKREESE